MIDTVVKIIDKMISLLKEREQNKRLIFLDHVDPMFKEMEIIHKDYISTFTSLISTPDKTDYLQSVRESLVQKKPVFENIRVKLHTYAAETQKKTTLPDEVLEFFNICANYFTLHGGVVQGQYQSHYSDMLKLLDAEPSQHEQPEQRDGRDDMSGREIVAAVRLMLKELRFKWEAVTVAYAKCRLALLK